MAGLRGRALIAYLLVCTVWGSTYLAIRIGVQELPPLLFAGVRFLLAGGMLAAIVVLSGDRLPSRRPDWGILAVVGVLLLLGGNAVVVWAEQFVESCVVRGLRAAWLLVGRDFRFGAKRGGDFELLGRLAARHGYELEAMPEVALQGERVSSSGVRAALAAGDLAAAQRLLGRPYAMSGRIAHGEKLGRELGFPTANIVLPKRAPVAGIFVVECLLQGETRWRQGVASVGRRPTVNPTAAPLLEVHLLDYAADLYRRHLRVRFLRKLRDERKYDDVPALRAAIAGDAAQARTYFAKKTNA